MARRAADDAEVVAVDLDEGLGEGCGLAGRERVLAFGARVQVARALESGAAGERRKT